MSNLKKGEELTKREYLTAMFLQSYLLSNDKDVMLMNHDDLVDLSRNLVDEFLTQTSFDK